MSHIAMPPSQGRAAFAALHRHREPGTDHFEGHYEEQYYQVENHDPSGGYDPGLSQRRFTDVDPIYKGREYAGAEQFEAHARSASHGSFKPQAYSNVVSMDDTSRPSPHETYGPGDSPPSYPTSSPPPPERERPNYKPSALRWPFLGLLLLVILSFIGLVVYAMYVLPHRDNNLGLDRPDEAHGARGLLGNSFGIVSTTRTTDGGRLLPRTASVTTPAPMTMTESVSTVTPPSIFSTRPEEDYGDVTGEVPDPPETRPADDYGDISGDDPTMTRPQDDYGDISGTDPTMTRPQDDYGVTSGIVGTPAPENYGDTSGVVTDGGVRATPTVVTVKPTGGEDGEVVQTLFLTPTMTTVETDSDGIPTTTIAVYPSITAAIIRTSQTTVLTDSQGQPTSTAIKEVLATESVTVETDSNGVPTATKTGYGVVSTAEPEKDPTGWSISYGEYFVGRFLPAVLAMLISIPIRVLDLNARIFQPWHELTRPSGTSGRKSLCLETGGFQGLVNTVRWVFGGQVLIAITTMLVLASSLLVPLSAEAIALDLRGNCVKGSGKGKTCIYVLSIFKAATGATLALLALMALLVLVLLVFLARWRSGVGTNPWSICGAASLSLNEDVRRIFNNLPNGANLGKQPGDVLVSALKDRSFTLGHFYNLKGGIEYGVVLQGGDGIGQPLNKPEVGAGGSSPPDESWYSGEGDKNVQRGTQQPLFMLGYFGRGLLLFVLCGVLALILYYNTTGGETSFEHFMMSESFGVRFLFTAVGFIITLCWSSFFNGVAVISPFHLLEQKPQPAQRSILLAPPTNAISGIWTAVRRRHGYLAAVAVTAVLAEFLPILLSEIPFRVSQTALVHRITTWSAVGVLGTMVLVLLCSFVVRWPCLPVDPTTIAGAMYYVTDSYMLNSFQGLSTLGREERDRSVANLKLSYQCGRMMGMSGKPRLGVDVAQDTPVTAW